MLLRQARPEDWRAFWKGTDEQLWIGRYAAKKGLDRQEAERIVLAVAERKGWFILRSRDDQRVIAVGLPKVGKDEAG